MRYIPTVSPMREFVGKIGIIKEIMRGWEGDNRYALGGECNLSRCRECNLELVGPSSPFEESLIAYIAKEKKELGLG